MLYLATLFGNTQIGKIHIIANKFYITYILPTDKLCIFSVIFATSDLQ